MAKLLIEHGASVNDSNNSVQWTPLHFASLLGNNDIVKLLIRKGADVNAIAMGEEKFTPIYFATYRNQLETAKMLLDSGAFTNNTGFYASAFFAKQNKLRPLDKLLIERAKDEKMLQIIIKAIDGSK